MTQLLKRTSILAVASLACFAPSAFATFAVQNASVTHYALEQFSATTSTVVYSTSTPVSSFNTIDSHNSGVIFTADPDAIHFRTQPGYGTSTGGQRQGFYSSGNVTFTSDATFSLSPQGGTSPRGIPQFTLAVQQLGSGLFWRWGTTTNNVIPHSFGDLNGPLPAGTYSLQWDQTPGFQMGDYVMTTLVLDLATVPEPHALGLFAVSVLLRRRR